MVFVRSMMESKRCWDLMSTYLKLTYEQKHKQCMSQSHVTNEEALAWIRVATDLVVPPGTKYRPGGCVPTPKATFDTSRRCGGAHSEQSIGVALSLFSQGLTEAMHERQEQDSLEEYWDRQESAQSLHDVEYQAIPEPGKYRVITKGPGDLYTGLRRLQGFLLNRWARMPFGTMVEHMDERFRIRFLELEENRTGAFCSGDYSSATDLMHTDATVECIERILENTGLTKTLVGVSAWNSLIGSRIHYGKKDSLLQSNGQLMGHPLSFPILCIINLSTYLRTMEYRSRTDAYLAPVLINGDDILFRGDTTTF
jgi:hypothetical protein